MTVRGLQPQPEESLGGTIGQSLGQADRLFEMRDGLVVGGSVQRPVTCLDPPLNGGLAEPRLREMMGDDLRLGVSCLEPIAQGLGNAPVQHLPATLEQVLVGYVLNQRVLESVNGFRRLTAAEHKLRVLKLGERVLQRRLVEPDQRAQQKIRELAPDRGTDLGDLPHRGQAVEARHQRVMERRGDGERGQRSIEPIAIGVLNEDAGFQHRLGQFLDEQWVAIRLDHDLFCHFGGQRAAARHPRDHAFDVRAVETAQRQGADIEQTNPRRLELRPEGEQRQYWELANPLDSEVEQFEGGGIGPVYVLKKEQRRLLPRETLDLVEQCRQCLAALLRGAKRERRVSFAERDREQRRKKPRDSLSPRFVHGEDRFEFVELLLGCIVGLKPRRPL